MSGQGYDELRLLNRKLDELLNRYNDLKAVNRELGRKNEELGSLLKEHEEKIKKTETEFERLKLSGALLGGGENVTEAKKKITELVREIDRCVALLNR
ncbi:MAG: hypothetical protein RBU28_07490 [Bacteroidales bacterium]|jgi:predicted  nucleic acid-binding Zn-ribbon protein|nr:hypothetical protein [Bacteroidales bacterium]